MNASMKTVSAPESHAVLIKAKTGCKIIWGTQLLLSFVSRAPLKDAGREEVREVTKIRQREIISTRLCGAFHLLYATPSGLAFFCVLML